MPWPQRSLKPKRSEFEIKMYLDVVFAKKRLFLAKQLSLKIVHASLGLLA